MLFGGITCLFKLLLIVINNLYLSMLEGTELPYAMMNIINGGAHADNNLEFQNLWSFPLLIVLKKGYEWEPKYSYFKKDIKRKGYNTAVGDEGGFAPNLASNIEALDLIMMAIEKAGYIAGKNVFRRSM